MSEGRGKGPDLAGELLRTGSSIALADKIDAYWPMGRGTLSKSHWRAQAHYIKPFIQFASGGTLAAAVRHRIGPISTGNSLSASDAGPDHAAVFPTPALAATNAWKNSSISPAPSR